MFLSLLYVNAGGDPERPSPGAAWLRDVYRVHQRLWMAFPGDEKRNCDPFFVGSWSVPEEIEPKPRRERAGFLFRIEADGPPRILVQSAQRPDWEYAFQNAPYLLRPKREERWRVREFEPAVVAGERLRFRLLANVARSRTVPDPTGRTRQTASGLTIARRRRVEMPVALGRLPDKMPTDPQERQRIIAARWDPWREWLQAVGERRGFIVERPEALRMEAVHVSIRRPNADEEAGAAQRGRRVNAGLFEGVLRCTDADRLRDALIGGIGHAKAFGFGLLSVARPA